MTILQRLGAWHETKKGLFLFAALELLIAYAFISLAIDRGNLWYYILTLMLLFGSLQNVFKLIGKLAHGK